MPTDQVRGLKAHGPSPAKGILGCVWIVGDNGFSQPDSCGTSPAKAKLFGRFPLLFGRKIFPDSPALSRE